MRSKVFIFLSFFATSLFYLGWWSSTLLPSLDYKLYDFLTSSNPPQSHSTVIIEIDEKSLHAFGQWPWPRVITSELINKIAEGKPAATVADILFSEPDRTSPHTLDRFYRDFFHVPFSINGLPEGLMDNDRMLAKTIQNNHIVLPVLSNLTVSSNTKCTIKSSDVVKNGVLNGQFYTTPNLVCNLPIIQENVGGIGHIHASSDKDGILRRLPLILVYDKQSIPILGMAAIASVGYNVILKDSNRFLGGIRVEAANHHFYVDEKSEVMIRFYPKQWYQTVSAVDLLSGQYDVKKLQGKFVFIGTTASGLDSWHTASDGTIRPGIFANATFVENFFNDDLGVQPSIYQLLNLFLSFGIALLLMILMIRKKYLSVIILFFTVSFIYTLITLAAVSKHIYLSSGYFILPLVSYLFVLALLMFFIDYRNKKKFFEDIQRANAIKQDLEEKLDISQIEIEHQKAVMFQQSKLAAMGEMIENIAHQWRQPLNLLGLKIQDLGDAYEYGDMDAGYIAKMTNESMEQIQYMSKTIDDFRNFVNPNQKAVRFELNTVIAESVKLLSSTLKTHNIDCTIIPSMNSPMVFGIESELKQVIVNLINNAKDALQEHEQKEGKITIHTESDNDNAKIMIEDNGGGIPKEVINRIFEPYFTTKEEGKGTGIGLYMSYVIINNKMKGTIEVSNTQSGALFVIILPLAK
ncbi:MAG: CHASE2 domain-containing protein [Sulfuricurvum sp.]|nr:CHASE2 domain-containing protein [Sulfuricurvum sp.]